jgi:peptidoglycan/xylan/chitin deacetylase (PgdA/CDA1 family)
MWQLSRDSSSVALTFDDGPHPEYTDAVLRLLAQHGVKATFFLIGRNVKAHPEIVQRIAAEGHSLGGHTFEHREIVTLDDGELAQELSTCRAAIRDATGVDTLWFRPPRGRMNLTSLRRIAGLGYRTVHWTKTYSDYKCDGSGELLQRMREQPALPRDVVLLHDHNPYTVEALATAIPFWKSSGLSFQAL